MSILKLAFNAWFVHVLRFFPNIMGLYVCASLVFIFLEWVCYSQYSRPLPSSVRCFSLILANPIFVQIPKSWRGPYKVYYWSKCYNVYS